MSATTTAPVALVHDLLDPGTLDKRVTRATSSLTEAGWRQRKDSRWITWTAPDDAHGIRLDTYAITHPSQGFREGLRAWTAWRHATSGPGPSASPPACRPTY